MPLPSPFSSQHFSLDVPRAQEQAIVARVRVGDAGAFETVFRSYYEGLFRFVYSYVGAHDAAEELVQEVFASLWERRATWTVKGSVRAYLYGAARNRVLNDLRHRRVVRRMTLGAADLEAGGEIPGMGEAALPADERLHDSDLQSALNQAVSELPERYRRVINLRSEHGLTYAEIAEVLGIPARTVETQVGRAVKALREQLKRFLR